MSRSDPTARWEAPTRRPVGSARLAQPLLTTGHHVCTIKTTAENISVW